MQIRRKPARTTLPPTHLTEAAYIARELARSNPTTWWGRCTFCRGRVRYEIVSSEHGSLCPYRLAVEWVARNPGPRPSAPDPAHRSF